MNKIIWSILFVAVFTNVNLLSQKVGFFNSQMIRQKLPDARLAEQRLQSVVEEWKREIKSMEDKEEALQFDIRKNRLIWSDSERTRKEREIADLQSRRMKFVREKFEPNAEHDKFVMEIMRPVEEKIFAAVQQVASKEKFDYIWDQSTQPLAYVNFRYDITLKVLKLLGVDVTAEEREQEQKISQDPRNDEDRRRESQTPRRRSRTAPPERTDRNSAQPNTMQEPTQMRDANSR